uniref:Uncharacterized protein n=1 Tax=Picea glauca TaxID=3330 RepID=A0A124GP44_PICGL|nr:hypothetical protein ABT39_MTgene670 [Picea glauca]
MLKHGDMLLYLPSVKHIGANPSVIRIYGYIIYEHVSMQDLIVFEEL